MLYEVITNSGREQEFVIQRQSTQMELQNRVITKLIWGLYLENTQIIYDAVHTLALEESLSSASGKYYLENFNLFKLWNKSFFESIDNGSYNFV